MQIKYDQMPLKYKLEEEETTVWSHFGKKNPSTYTARLMITTAHITCNPLSAKQQLQQTTL